MYLKNASLEIDLSSPGVRDAAKIERKTAGVKGIRLFLLGSLEFGGDWDQELEVAVVGGIFVLQLGVNGQTCLYPTSKRNQYRKN
jgi:hypothetical protein